ncbi:MAG: TonB-dependent receptor [Vicinamibacterales bacterium]
MGGSWVRARVLWGVVLAITITASVLGQDASATLTGSVTDVTGAAVADTPVELFGAARRSVRTDSEGRFRVDQLPFGEYRIEVEREGFATHTQAVNLDGAGPGELSIVLSVAGVSEYVTTVSKVREEAQRTPFLTATVGGEQLREIAAATFEEALVTIPGLQHGTQGNAFTRVSTRGLRDTADVLVVLDGIPFRQLNGSADLTMLPVPAFQGVEFVKGPASSVYGRSAIGGVMQVFTVPAATSRPSGEVRLGYSSFDTREANLAGQVPWPGGRASATLSLSRSDGFQERTGRDTTFATVTADHTVRGRARLRGQYLVSDVEAGRGSIIPLQNGRPLFGITREDNFGIDGARFEGRLHSGTLNGQVDLGRGLLLTNNANFNQYTRYSTGGITIVPPPTASNKGWNESTAVQDTFINDTMLQWDAGTTTVRSSLLVGLTAEHGTQDQDSPSFSNAPTYRGPDYLTPVSNVNNNPKGIQGAVVNSAFEQTIVSLYVQERVDFGRVGGVVGLRWDDFDQSLVRSDTSVVSSSKRSRLSPRVGIDVVALRRTRGDVTAFANWVEGFRPQFPALSTQSGVTIPQLLRPEVTRSLEGGVKLREGILSAQVGVFNMRKIDGQRSFRSSPDDFIFVNATTRVRGVEAEGRVQLEQGHNIWAHYAFHDARHIEFRPTLTSIFDGFRLRMAPRHIAGVGGSVRVGRASWTTSLSYVGTRPLRDNIVNPQILPSYTLLDSAVSVRVVEALRVVLFGSNLANKYYIGDDFSSQDAGNAGTPRRVGVQVTYQF